MKKTNKYYRYYPFKIRNGFKLKKTNKVFEKLKFATFHSQRKAITMGKIWYGKWKGYDEIDFPKIKCKLCKRKFRKNSSSQILCSENCKKSYKKEYSKKYRKNTITNCKICNKVIKRKTNDNYCSDKCRKLKEKIRKAKYLQENRELCMERKRKWKENNWDKYIKSTKKYREQNKEKEKKWRKIYLQKNKDKILEKQNKYRKKNPLIPKAHWLAIKIPIKNHKCVICNKKIATERHHENYKKPYEIWLCCGDCHKEIDKQRRARVNKEW